MSKNTTQKGTEYEAYVASLYEGLGYRVDKNITLYGQQIDILAQRFEPGIGHIRIIIECKYRENKSVSNQDVYDFISMFKAIRDVSSALKGIMVTNTAYSTQANSASEVDNIELYTSNQLESELFDVRNSSRALIRSYEQRQIAAEYISLGGHGTVLNADGTDHNNLQEVIHKWIDSPSIGLLSILADYGAGKSTLIERIQYEYCAQYVNGTSTLKPLLLRLKDYEKFNSLDELMLDTVRRDYQRIVPIDLLWKFLSNGEFLVLMDGFDEIALRSSKDVRKERIQELLPIVAESKQALLTCRPAYFVSEDEYHDALSAMTGSHLVTMLASSGPRGQRQLQKESRQLRSFLRNALLLPRSTTALRSIDLLTVTLSSLSKEQIQEHFLSRKSELENACGVSLVEIESFVSETYDLSDLVRRPILLKMITDTLTSGRVDVKNLGSQFGPAELYEIYIAVQFDIDWEKGDVRKLFSPSQRRDYAEKIAVLMFDSGQLEVDLEQLSSITDGDEAMLTDVTTCTFLTRSGKLFQFSHRSFAEFFTARFLARKLSLGEKDERFARKLSQEILYFLGAFCLIESKIRASLIDWIRHKSFNNRETNMIFRRNLFGALLQSGRKLTNVRIAADIINDISIRKTTLEVPRFTDTSFNHVNLHDVHFEGGQLSSVSLTDCSWSNVSASNVRVQLNCHESELINLSLNQCDVSLTGSSKLVGWKLKNSSLRLSNSLSVSNIFAETSRIELGEEFGHSVRLSGELIECSIDFRTARRSSGVQGRIKISHSELIFVADELWTDVLEIADSVGLVLIRAPRSKPRAQWEQHVKNRFSGSNKFHFVDIADYMKDEKKRQTANAALLQYFQQGTLEFIDNDIVKFGEWPVKHKDCK